MEYHDMQEIEVKEPALFKGVNFTTINKKLYCENTEEFLIPGEMMDENDIRLKDNYRKVVGLLTSKEIQDIRSKYSISQKDLSKILEWGELTITRYENHYVQDWAHNDILEQIKKNPLFLYEKLKTNKNLISKTSYNRVMQKTREILDESGDFYLRNSILSEYQKYFSAKFQGNTELNLNKVVDTINIFAENVEELYVVKLMKLLWYSDFLNYRRYGKGITGLCYFRNEMGALPRDYDKIILLKDINSVDVFVDGNLCKRFEPAKEFQLTTLTNNEINTIMYVIDQFGRVSRKDIVDTMHEEDAFIYTPPKNPISYEWATTLHLE